MKRLFVNRVQLCVKIYDDIPQGITLSRNNLQATFAVVVWGMENPLMHLKYSCGILATYGIPLSVLDSGPNTFISKLAMVLMQKLIGGQYCVKRLLVLWTTVKISHSMVHILCHVELVIALAYVLFHTSLPMVTFQSWVVRQKQYTFAQWLRNKFSVWSLYLWATDDDTVLVERKSCSIIVYRHSNFLRNVTITSCVDKFWWQFMLVLICRILIFHEVVDTYFRIYVFQMPLSPSVSLIFKTRRKSFNSV